MEFRIFVKRLTVDMFMFFALLISALFFYQQMVPFIRAAFLLKALNAQTLSYILYTILILILPLFFLMNFKRHDKSLMLRGLFYIIAAIIAIGTISDLVINNFFIGYRYSEGDTVFVNIMWNMPNLFGVLHSAILCTLYVFLGKWVRRRRKITLYLFIGIFAASFIVPFIYTFITSGMLPRETWLEKALFIMSEYMLMVVSLGICSTSRALWKHHVWY